MSLRWRAFAELQDLKKAMEERAQREAAAAAARALEQKRLAAQRNLFQLAVGAVHALPDKGRMHFQPTPPPPIAQQQIKDEQAAFMESLSDEMDISTLLDTDAQLSFSRPGVGPEVAQRLRLGHWSIQRQIDLHGLRTDGAREALSNFIRESQKQGVRCVRVVHGKGHGSPGKTPVLKDKVHRWLVQKSEEVAFVQAPRAHGGGGALVVLLQPLRHRTGLR